LPVLLLNSLGDRMVDPGCTQAIARAWQIEPKTHPCAGHDLPLDDPGWVVEAVVDWWLRLK
jgi:pimeloyl-ACP methyl ester carboxylesterase